MYKPIGKWVKPACEGVTGSESREQCKATECGLFEEDIPMST